MASPMPNQPYGSWNAHSQSMPPQPEQDDSGLQVKPMGLKVHYTFDKDSKINCLARYPHTLSIQTVPIDEVNSIGIIDLRLCIKTITECSPELAGQECDYTIYAYDYSEPDTPLAGQGMLSRAIDSLQSNVSGQPPKMVTGRVTKNLLGVFGGGNRETLEVKLKLTEAGKRQPSLETPQYAESQHQQQSQTGPAETALTPTGAAEWNSFIQSNPHMGQPGAFSRGASPALSQGPPPSMHERRDSFTRASQQSMQQTSFQRIAPQPVDTATAPTNISMAPTSRPSSRASNSGRVKKAPTGRPRGRPRKKPAEGNTSGYEDGTEGEDGPSKKRAKTIKAEKPNLDPFGAGPDSLRVAASTSGSIRSFRPVGMNNEGAPGSHLQEVPRAPTPVPKGPISGHPGRNKTNLRRESTMNREIFVNQPSPLEERQSILSPGQEDGRSPESTAPTPAYSDDSQAEIGSSPPVQPTTSFLRSSPPLSSPDLPPMPEPRGANGEKLPNEEELGDLFGEEPIQAPPIERVPTYPQNRKQGPRKPTSTVPMQIFRMEAGPDGQDMVHIGSYNTPDMSPAVSGAPNVSTTTANKKRSSKPRAQPAQKKPQIPSPPSLAPTPPPTTDGVDKSISPMPATSIAESFNTIESNPTPPASFLAFVPGPPTATYQTPTEVDDTLSKVMFPKEADTREQEPSRDRIETPKEANPPKPKETKPRPPPRKLARSQSAGPLALPLPTVPASEPAGPSSLSQSMTAEPDPVTKIKPSTLRRSTSTGPLAFPIPASDPVGPSNGSAPQSSLMFPEPCRLADVPPLPSSPTGSKSNKNIVKKHAIKQRLEAAIMNGEMPPFCSNCGAIETPTWRKIWVQEFEGVPGQIDFSAKPGKVTALEILTRDSDDKPTSYRLIKKSLGDEEDKPEWQGHLLCNPCGIWLVKSHCHRPQDRWEKDASRLGQGRRKRGTGAEGGRSRSKKSRTKSDAQLNQPAQAPEAQILPQGDSAEVQQSQQDDSTMAPGNPQNKNYQPTQHQNQSLEGGDMSNETQRYLGSTHSRGSGGVKTPSKLDKDDGLGTTKRLLFPSPRKDDSPKTLGEVDINIVHINDECRQLKGLEGEENTLVVGEATAMEQEELEALFRSPAVVRPSTPPPNTKAAPPSTPFKTPSRTTPSHRPITRSVSRSIRSRRSKTSPGDVERTPTKTPLSRRSTRNMQSDDNFGEELRGWDTPCSTAIAKMLSDSQAMLSDPNFGFSDEMDIDFSDLPPMEATQNLVKDVSNWLSTDGAVPTSPDKHAHFFDYDGSADVLEQWNLMHGVEIHRGKK